MATGTTKPNDDERSCPFCAETIKKAAIVCKHCKRDLPAATSESGTKPATPPTVQAKVVASEETSSAASQKMRTASNQKVWGIILVSFGALSLFTGDFSVGKFIFLIALPVGLGIWLLRKAKENQGVKSSSASMESAAKAVAGVTSKTEDFSKIVSTKAKAFFSVKKNLYVTLGATVAILALVIGLGIKADIDQKALVAEAAAVQAQKDKEQDAKELAFAVTTAETLITDGTARYEESSAWSNDADRAALQQALSKLKTALKAKDYAPLVSATKVASDAFKKVGTQEEATARAEAEAAKAAAEAEAAAKEAAAQAEAARIAAETTGQKNATAKAKSYLRYQAFSRQGLIEQLQYEGYSLEDSTYGTDYSGADWYAQAVKKGASYLKYQAFSSQGLYEQLLYEGFTPDEAQHGVSQNGY